MRYTDTRGIGRVTKYTVGPVVYDKRHPFAPNDMIISDRHLFDHPDLQSHYRTVYLTRKDAEEAVKLVNKVHGVMVATIYIRSMEQ